jgi:hypothetical protein
VPAPQRIERWAMDEVKRYLELTFLETTVDVFPRGAGSAVLFRVEGLPSHREPRRTLHQLWVDQSFFARCPDRSALQHALEGADVQTSMKLAGDRIVELR